MGRITAESQEVGGDSPQQADTRTPCSWPRLAGVGLLPAGRSRSSHCGWNVHPFPQLVACSVDLRGQEPNRHVPISHTVLPPDRAHRALGWAEAGNPKLHQLPPIGSIRNLRCRGRGGAGTAAPQGAQQQEAASRSRAGLGPRYPWLRFGLPKQQLNYGQLAVSHPQPLLTLCMLPCPCEPQGRGQAGWCSPGCCRSLCPPGAAGAIEDSFNPVPGS